MLEIERINKIAHAVMFGVAAEEICRSDEERALYASLQAQNEGWMAGSGMEMINDG